MEEKPSPRKRKTNHKPEAKTATGLVETTPTGRGNGKYIKKDKVGKPTLGRSPNYVSKPGLNNLTVVHVQGYNDADAN